MRQLLIADKDTRARQQMLDIFDKANYEVAAADSLADVLHDIIRGGAQVLVLGSELEEIPTVDLIPLLKRCNRALTIILVSDEASLPLIRRFRREGIFYHALKPVSADDQEELRQAVRCAFARGQPAPSAAEDEGKA